MQSCDPEAPKVHDTITAKVTYIDPATLAERSDEHTVKLGAVVESDASQLYKADVIVNYAKAFIAIDAMIDAQNYAQAIMTASDMVDWLQLAANTLGDAEIGEMVDVMDAYRLVLEQQFG